MNKLKFLKFSLSLLLGIVYTTAFSQTNCSVDTVNYTYYKTTQFRAVSLNSSSSGNSFAQYFPAPQALTIHGFDFYAWQSAGSNAVVSLTCNLYKAGTDSLPTGSPIRSVTVNVDSAFGSGQLPVLRKSAIFGSSVTLNFPYIITVENPSSTNVSVITNDYLATTPNGRKEWLSSVRLGANYFRSYNINIGGITMDADFIFMPQVSYTLNADFTFTECNNTTNTITFTNNSSAIVNSPFYNRYAFYGITQFCYLWDYGDTTGLYYTINGSHKYNHRVVYKPVLKDTVYGWTVGCADTTGKEVPYSPEPPKITNSSPHCSGDTLRFTTTDTVPGGAYLWKGPNGFTSTQANFEVVSDSTHHGNFGLTVELNGCKSATSNTFVLIHPTPKVPVATNDGPKCVGDSVDFTASSPSPGITYVWQGPNGFSSSSDNFRFTNLDTTFRGSYTVYVEDAFCKSVPDTAELYIYPPPQPPVLGTFTGSTLCEDDSLYLQGNSVTAAVFSWQGPASFSSSATHPVIANISAANAGFYKAHVIIGSCTSTSDSIEITIKPQPQATITSGNTTVCDGDSVALAANTGTSLTYQWLEAGNPISGQQAENFAAKTSGGYSVKVTNAVNCSKISNPVNVTVNPNPLAVISTTGNTTFCAGDSLLITADTATDYSYQWLEAGNPINGQQAENFTAKATGDYSVLVTNGFNCNQTSNLLNVTVNPLPVISNHPVSQAINSGTPAVFTVASPDVGAAFQWQINAGSGFTNLANNPPYSGVQTNALSIATNPTLNGYQYRCEVSLAGCITLSNTAALTINIGIDEVASGTRVNIYPNPATSTLNVALELDNPAPVTLSIVDITGREVLNTHPAIIDGKHLQTLQIDNLAKGIYLLKVQAGSYEKVLRFTVNN